MILKYLKAYLSIEQFNPVDLPPLTILSGENGSGKTHLLEAIEKKQIIFEEMKNPKVARFTFDSFKLTNEPIYTTLQIVEERERCWKFIQDKKKDFESIRNLNKKVYEQAKLYSAQYNLPLFSYQEEPAFIKMIEQFQAMLSSHPSNVDTQPLRYMARNLPVCLDELNKSDFDRYYKPISFSNDFLPQQIGKVIWEYYIKYRRNQINAFFNEKKAKTYPVLSEDEFIQQYGDKPWEILNRILKQFQKIPYQIESPEGRDDNENYKLTLIHTEKKNLKVDFSNLSSGERILLSVAASLFRISSDSFFPEILLLDEIDSTLHPSSISAFLNVINDVFIRYCKIIILVTHSPTTIALAPEESIFIMNKSGQDRIIKKDRKEALEILTEGYATIEKGIKLFDQISKKDISIITEGKNTKLIKKACELFDYSQIEIIEGAEGKSGDTQLRTLFDFLSKVPHDKKVIFVWDCDAYKYSSLIEGNNTYKYIFSKNDKNDIAKKGIENAFDSSIIDERFIKEIKLPGQPLIKEFADTKKRDFEDIIISRNLKDDFKHFIDLFEKINSLKKEYK